MLAADALNRRDEKFGVWLHRQTDKAGNVGSFLPDSHRLHKSGLRIDDCARKHLSFFLVANMGAEVFELLQRCVVSLIVDDNGLFGRADRAVIKRFRDDDVDDCVVQVGRFFQIHRSVSRADSQRRLA